MKYVILFFFLTTFSYGQSFDQVVDSSKIVFPDIAKAISAHETGNYKSVLYKKHNNAFGFKGRHGYKKYSTIQESIQDYLELEARVILKYSPKTAKEFLNFLARRYARDPNWKRRVKTFL